jgi:hypothetical protein
MTNKVKDQMDWYQWNFQDIKMLTKSRMRQLRSLQNVFLYSVEPEPVYINGQYLYV